MRFERKLTSGVVKELPSSRFCLEDREKIASYKETYVKLALISSFKNNRPLAQLIFGKEVQGVSEHRSEVYRWIHEPPSTGNDVAIQSQNQLRKRFNDKKPDPL